MRKKWGKGFVQDKGLGEFFFLSIPLYDVSYVDILKNIIPKAPRAESSYQNPSLSSSWGVGGALHPATALRMQALSWGRSRAQILNGPIVSLSFPQLFSEKLLLFSDASLSHTCNAP